MTDKELISSKLKALLGDDISANMYVVIHDGAPATKSRARWDSRRGHIYTPGKTVKAQEALSWKFLEEMRGETIQGGVAIVAIFFRPNYQRIDCDNMMKLVMDAATHANVWKDDCFVMAQAAFVEFDRQNPRTLIGFCSYEASLDRLRHFTCEICGLCFMRARVATFAAPPKFCSKECRKEGYNRTRLNARCAKCNKEFHRKTAGQKYCSHVCANSSPMRRQKDALQRPWAKCCNCGERVSRREYIRCTKCAPRGRKLGSRNKTWKGVPISGSTEDNPKAMSYDEAELPF